MGHNNVALGHPRSTRIWGLTGCQLDPRIWGVTLAFRQTLRYREFSYLCYFYLKGHLMAWEFLKGHERP